MGIPKMWLKLSFSYPKWDLQAILTLTVFLNFLVVQTLTPLFSLTVPNFGVFFQASE